MTSRCPFCAPPASILWISTALCGFKTHRWFQDFDKVFSIFFPINLFPLQFLWLFFCEYFCWRVMQIRWLVNINWIKTFVLFHWIGRKVFLVTSQNLNSTRRLFLWIDFQSVWNYSSSFSKHLFTISPLISENFPSQFRPLGLIILSKNLLLYQTFHPLYRWSLSLKSPL